MPRGFTESEKNTIRKRLIETGREAFGRYGLRKTSVDELARGAGISKGAFYGFFDSKEALYFGIVRDYEAEQHRRLAVLMEGETDDERARFKGVIRDIFSGLEKDPFLLRLLDREDYDYLWRRLTPEQKEEALTADTDLAEELARGWKARGKLRVDDPRVLAGALRALFTLSLHREDIGEEVFPQVIDLLLEGAVDRLIER